ncbi:hypothetical protein CFT61_07890 [Segatella copri]|uniref:Uncharacterized protein n=1 Tax=Segatella copri TaxID=165179 RepID=A0AA91TJY1_9BACT|nr:hypothetical protein CFT61_07890 [Segatella copri]
MLVLAFFFLGEYKAFALSGRIVHSWITQGVALGWELLPFQGVLVLGASALSGRIVHSWFTQGVALG